MKPIHQQISVLFTAQALALTSNVTFIAVNGLAGAQLTDNASFATLPITFQVFAAALATYPASLFMQKYGRRAGFSLGAVCGMVGALLAAWGVMTGSMALLCAGSFIAGCYNAIGSYLRFAAADAADVYQPSYKAQAIALVLAGGIAGGVIGPEMSKLTRTLLPAQFAGTYLGLACFAALALIVVQFIRIPQATAAQNASMTPARPYSVVFRQPLLQGAILCGAVVFALMNLLMTATPLAMKVCGYAFNDAAFVIEWHVIAMFAPGFVTGKLNMRFGTARMMFIGGFLVIAAALVNLSGIALWQFWVALVLLGLGWNFMFTGATTLLTQTYTPAEKARVQGINDLFVFCALITSSFSSGVLVATQGWQTINALAIPVMILTMGLFAWLLKSHEGQNAKS